MFNKKCLVCIYIYIYIYIYILAVNDFRTRIMVVKPPIMMYDKN